MHPLRKTPTEFETAGNVSQSPSINQRDESRNEPSLF